MTIREIKETRRLQRAGSTLASVFSTKKARSKAGLSKPAAEYISPSKAIRKLAYLTLPHRA